MVTTLYLIHHSHTDVGYTDIQSLVVRRQVDFIRQVLRAVEATAPLAGEHFDGFRWTCETFWAVERFLEEASSVESDAFARAVREGDIGLSGSYLNLNELVDYESLLRLFGRAAEYGGSVGAVVDSAMTADVNGYSWGFAQAMLQNGIRNLLTCIHTHHGMFPLGRQQTPFWWESHRGERVLVWSGEHYHFGNELGIAPAAVSSYLTKDECDARMIFGDHWAVAELRIPRYLSLLESADYPYDFAPIAVSGLRSDNAPPSPAIAGFVSRWNREHGDLCRMKMSTLSGFFRVVRSASVELPVHRGDWPDWWSDGPAGNPVSTALFRNAQRCLRRYRSLRARYPWIPARGTEAAENNLALYAEHTFGHANSMSEPWHPIVHAVAETKRAYAAMAHDEVRGLLDEALSAMGASGLEPGLGLTFRAVNPLDRAVRGLAVMQIGHHEFNELGLDAAAGVIDPARDEAIPCQLRHTPTGEEFCVHLELQPGEERALELRPGGSSRRPPCPASESRRERPCLASESRADAGPRNPRQDMIGTPFVEIVWEQGAGIVSWYDRVHGRELLRSDRRH
ncbi:MAG: glycoside hydrolase, partial [Candidatus Eisenbacteria bacterium]|nr:glycoside hydrolase [Candidatus Eisenbacteria bacterium]